MVLMELSPTIITIYDLSVSGFMGFFAQSISWQAASEVMSSFTRVKGPIWILLCSMDLARKPLLCKWPQKPTWRHRKWLAMLDLSPPWGFLCCWNMLKSTNGEDKFVGNAFKNQVRPMWNSPKQPPVMCGFIMFHPHPPWSPWSLGGVSYILRDLGPLRGRDFPRMKWDPPPSSHRWHCPTANRPRATALPWDRDNG